MNKEQALEVLVNLAYQAELPKVSAGVSSGDVWSQNGTLKIGSPSDNFTVTSTAVTLTVDSDTTE